MMERSFVKHNTSCYL